MKKFSSFLRLLFDRLYSTSPTMSEETQNARLELADAYSTWTHRLNRYDQKETTLNSLHSALLTTVEPAVRSVFLLCFYFFRLYLSCPRPSSSAGFRRILQLSTTQNASPLFSKFATPSTFGRRSTTRHTKCRSFIPSSRNSALSTNGSRRAVKVRPTLLLLPLMVHLRSLRPQLLLLARRYSSYYISLPYFSFYCRSVVVARILTLSTAPTLKMKVATLSL